MKLFTQIETDINRNQKNFVKPSATGALWKMLLWVIRPVHYLTVRGHSELCKFDANVDAPEKSKRSFARAEKDDLADIQESIADFSKDLRKLNDSLVKAQAKVANKTGKKRTKAMRKITEITESISSVTRKIGQNQELHAKISKKLNKKGLLFED